jgi:hypothetical protein
LGKSFGNTCEGSTPSGPEKDVARHGSYDPPPPPPKAWADNEEDLFSDGFDDNEQLMFRYRSGDDKERCAIVVFVLF